MTWFTGHKWLSVIPPTRFLGDVMIPVLVCYVGGHWWQRRWSVVLTVENPPPPKKAFTQLGAHNKGVRMLKRYDERN